MPQVEFTIRWADGTEQACVSPSRAIEQVFVAGGSYPRDELLRRAQEGLQTASERVREQFGMACTAAAEQRQEIVDAAPRHGEDANAISSITAMRRACGPPAFPAPERIGGHHDVIVIGGGQAGLAASHCLGEHGVEHLVLERDRAAHAWQDQRWDSFCLVTPNWQCRLPGHPYSGPDTNGFMVKDEILEYLDSYVHAASPPLLEGVRVRCVEPAAGGSFRVSTSHGELSADQVVLAVGGYHIPSIPRLAESLPRALTQLHSSTYRNPASLPDGAVLVVGTGQSGAQIAEDLLLAGRDVHLCVGSAPRVARFYRGRDCVAWLEDMGHYDMPIDEHPEGLEARHEPNHYVTGRDGGRDIDLRAHALAGMTLHGRLRAIDGSRVSLTGDLPQNLDAADGTAERIKDAIDGYIEREEIDAPSEERYVPVWKPDGDGGGTLDLDANGIRSVIWATGFRTDWSWVKTPSAFDDEGRAKHVRGVSPAEGLYFLGLPWLYTWGSGRFAGVARDARHVTEHIARRAAGRQLAA